MNKAVIEAATEAEREWAADLMAGSDPWIRLGRTPEQCRQACRHPESMLYVGHLNGQPSGFVLVQRRGVAGSPYIASLAVAENLRGSGLGSQLLEFTENLFPDAKHMFLCVSSFNRRARTLYERRGYAVVGELKDYLIKGASEILMHKRLRPE